MREKHMGSRACLIVCRDEESAARRFGTAGGSAGVCYTRTGRRFFLDADLEGMFIDRVRRAVTSTNLWEELETDGYCSTVSSCRGRRADRELLQNQYAPSVPPRMLP